MVESIDIGKASTSIENVYMTISGCQIGMITEFDFQRMRRNHPIIYKKIIKGIDYEYL